MLWKVKELVSALPAWKCPGFDSPVPMLMVMNACNPIPHKVESGRSEVQEHPQLHKELEIILS